MPMVGHIAENSLAIDHEFREGNAAPAARNLEFVQACERKMPKGKMSRTGVSVSETSKIPADGQKIARRAGRRETSHPLYCPKRAEKSLSA
jgi:hypothetical protein